MPSGIGTDECAATLSHRMARARPSSPVIAKSVMMCQGSESNVLASLVVEPSVPALMEALLFWASLPAKRRREGKGNTYKGFRRGT